MIGLRGDVIIFAAAQIMRIGFDTRRRRLLDRPLFLRKQFDLELLHDCFDDLVLDRKYIGQVVVVARSPNVPVALSFGQFGIDPHAIAGFPHASFDDIGDTKLAGRSLQVLGALTIRQTPYCGSARTIPRRWTDR